MTEETTTSELTPLKELTKEEFTAALEQHKASGLAKLYNVTVSTIHYYKDKWDGKKRQPSAAQLEARLEALKNRAEKAKTRVSKNSAASEAAKAEKLAQRQAAKAQMDARRQELLDQINALKASTAAPVTEG